MKYTVWTVTYVLYFKYCWQDKKVEHDCFVGDMFKEESLPFIVTVETVIVVGIAGLVYVTMTGAGVVSPKYIYIYTNFVLLLI